MPFLTDPSYGPESYKGWSVLEPGDLFMSDERTKEDHGKRFCIHSTTYLHIWALLESYEISFCRSSLLTLNLRYKCRASPVVFSVSGGLRQGVFVLYINIFKMEVDVHCLQFASHLPRGIAEMPRLKIAGRMTFLGVRRNVSPEKLGKSNSKDG